MTVELREPRADDARALARAWYEAERRSIDEAYPHGYPPEWFWMESVDQAEEQWLRGFTTPQPGVQSWVAVRDGVPVGFSQAGPVEGRTGRGALRSLYVDPRAWRSGAGSALHDAAVARLEREYERADLWVIQGNAKTRGFYERRGWMDAGELMRAPNGLPLVRYERTLR